MIGVLSFEPTKIHADVFPLFLDGHFYGPNMARCPRLRSLCFRRKRLPLRRLRRFSRRLRRLLRHRPAVQPAGLGRQVPSAEPRVKRDFSLCLGRFGRFRRILKISQTKIMIGSYWIIDDSLPPWTKNQLAPFEIPAARSCSYWAFLSRVIDHVLILICL